MMVEHEEYVGSESLRRKRPKNNKNNSITTIMIMVLTCSIMLFGSHLYFKDKFIINVKGSSMSKTLSDGDMVLLKKAKAVKGNIVIFSKPDSWDTGRENTKGEELIKRLVAVEGDEVLVDDGYIKVNGKNIFNLDSIKCDYNKIYRVKVPRGYFMAFGDNAKVSLDSRREYCIGKTENMLVKTSSILNTGVIIGKI